MTTPFGFLIHTWLKIFFLFAPFLTVSIFLGFTRDLSESRRRALALQATATIALTCFLIFFFGRIIFSLFGITLDAFRIGAGALLFLSAIELVQGKKQPAQGGDDDFIVVPFTIPIVVGPAVMGILFVLGADISNARERLFGLIALGLAVLCLGLMLLVASTLERIIGKKNLGLISRITGLILAALAAQMIFTGIGHFINLG